jgi:hypothetical protein
MHPMSMMNDSCYLAITFLSSHHKHLLLIISVSSTNSSSSSEVTMDTDPNPALPVMYPTVREMKTWDSKEVLRWIEQREPKLLKGNDLKSFKEANFAGSAFLLCSRKDFQECGLSFGVRLVLENLVIEVNGPKQSKLLSFIPYSKH